MGNRLARLLTIMILAVGLAGPLALSAQAQDGEAASLADFEGRWVGSGLLDTQDSLFMSMNRRDLDVTIEPFSGGFEVSWTTVSRGGDPEDPELERESSALTFYETDRPGVYEADDSGNPLDGYVMSWARLHGQTLSVYQMGIVEDGGYEVASYDRTLTGPGSMDLHFRRLRDGEPVRAVNGRLTREE
jgi:hypothetical protein